MIIESRNLIKIQNKNKKIHILNEKLKLLNANEQQIEMGKHIVGGIIKEFKVHDIKKNV